MSFPKLARISLTVSGILVLASLILLITPGPRLSVEFTGGTMMELDLPEGKTPEELNSTLATFPKDGGTLANANIARTRTDTYFVRLPSLTNEEHLGLLDHLKKNLGDVKELQYTTIGPTVGNTLKRQSFLAIGAALLAIIIYLAFAFRKMPRSLNVWSFGIAAIVALAHDILITMGIFTILSHYTTFQFDTLFATALLSAMGYSVSDTIVIFDRIRDNVFLQPRGNFTEITQASLKQSLSRTLSTGVGALIMLFALFLFGAESIRWFMLALIVGTVIGTYSSFFVATPLVVFFGQRKQK
jgi:preprotein translocase subunit SecF